MLKLLKFIDKILRVVIGWLYMKHTVIHLRLEAERSKKAGMYPPPTREEIEKVISEVQQQGIRFNAMSVPVPKNPPYTNI
jgi:hypothetical protein